MKSKHESIAACVQHIAHELALELEQEERMTRHLLSHRTSDYPVAHNTLAKEAQLLGLTLN